MSRTERGILEYFIAKEIGNSRYVLVINGLLQRANGHLIRVKLVDNKLVYFISRTNGGIRIDEPLEELNGVIANTVITGDLFGFDFSDWLASKTEGGNKRMPWTVKANTVTNLLFLESPMYNLFRTTYPGQGNLQATFTPEVSGGRTLDITERTQLLTAFRINGFRSIREIMEVNFLNRINRKSPPFYRATNAFFIGMVRIEELFNPFYDDKMIWDLVSGRELFQIMNERMTPLLDSRIEYARLSTYQVSKGLGLKVLVPMNFEIFFSLLVGFVMTEFDTPVDFPHKQVPAYRLLRSVAGYAPIISYEEWQALGSSEEQGYYTGTTSYNAFLLKNLRFFRQNGMPRANTIISTFADAILV